jgi:hypothetical protein
MIGRGLMVGGAGGKSSIRVKVRGQDIRVYYLLPKILG